MSSQMVLKPPLIEETRIDCFRSMSSQMVLKPAQLNTLLIMSFRSMSSQMVLKHKHQEQQEQAVLDLCHLKWY